MEKHDEAAEASFKAEGLNPEAAEVFMRLGSRCAVRSSTCFVHFNNENTINNC